MARLSISVQKSHADDRHAAAHTPDRTQRQVARPRAEVEDRPLVGAGNQARHPLSPGLVDVQAQQMVQEIVPGAIFREHTANPAFTLIEQPGPAKFFSEYGRSRSVKSNSHDMAVQTS